MKLWQVLKQELKRRREVLLENIITKSSLRNFGKNPVFILWYSSSGYVYEKIKDIPLKCLLFLGTQRPNVANVGTTSSNTPSRQPSRIPRAISSPNRSCPTTPSISRPPSSGSRPVTPSFSQSAEMINIYINYNEPDNQEWFL